MADIKQTVNVLQSTGNALKAGVSVPWYSWSRPTLTKELTGLVDGEATDVFAVTVPNAQHVAVIELDLLAVLGAAGKAGIGEATRFSKYVVVLVRRPGVATVVNVSPATNSWDANVSGADSIASILITVSPFHGPVDGVQTFTIQAAIAKSGGAADHHTLVVMASLLNQQVDGMTIV